MRGLNEMHVLSSNLIKLNVISKHTINRQFNDVRLLNKHGKCKHQNQFQTRTREYIRVFTH